jgi:hypothetical protein
MGPITHHEPTNVGAPQRLCGARRSGEKRLSWRHAHLTYRK